MPLVVTGSRISVPQLMARSAPMVVGCRRRRRRHRGCAGHVRAARLVAALS